MRCNNSLAILYRQPKASKLANCYCDGSEEFPCLKFKTYTERLCLNRFADPSSRPTTPTDIVAGSRGGEPQTNTADNWPEPDSMEDEVFNLTNDRDYQTAIHMAARAEESDEDMDETAITNTGEESSTKSFNGIQQVEDNWIPLMSGRYFTNLHDQRNRPQDEQLGEENYGVNYHQATSPGNKRQTNGRRSKRKNKQKRRLTNGEQQNLARRRNGRTHASSVASSAEWTVVRMSPVHYLSGICALIVGRHMR